MTKALQNFARRFVLFAAVFLAALAVTSGVKVNAEPIDNAMLLDPYDPVPQIQFHHGDCDWGCRDCLDGCGYAHCWHECGYRHCWHGCWHGRPWHCEFGCGPSLGQIFEERIQRYDYQADRNDALVQQYEVMAHHYAEQSCWYDWHVRGRICDPHWLDRRDGPPIGPDGPPPGAFHDGPPPPDWHDGPHP